MKRGVAVSGGAVRHGVRCTERIYSNPIEMTEYRDLGKSIETRGRGIKCRCHTHTHNRTHTNTLYKVMIIIQKH